MEYEERLRRRRNIDVKEKRTSKENKLKKELKVDLSLFQYYPRFEILFLSIRVRYNSPSGFLSFEQLQLLVVSWLFGFLSAVKEVNSRLLWLTSTPADVILHTNLLWSSFYA